MCNTMTGSLNVDDIDYDILLFEDQGDTRALVTTADISLEK